MNTPTPSPQPIKPWIISGIVFLYILALTWSIDASMVYLFLGISTFCFFMALRGWISTQPWKREQSSHHYQQERPKQDFSFDFNFNRGQQQRPSSAGRTQQPFKQYDAQKGVKRVIIGFVVIIGFFFFVVIIGVLFGSDDESEVQYYRDQAQLYFDSQQYDSARVYYRKVITRRPDESLPRIDYGKTFYYQEQYDSAIIMFNKASEASPDDIDAKLFRGRSYYYQKKYNEALSEAELLLADAPDYNEGMLLAGDVLYAQEKFEEALTTYYEPAYEAGARSMMLCWIMAYIYDEKRKDMEKAIPLYKEALTYDDTVVDIYKRLSEITREPEAGEYRRKVAELQK
jgi:tetratricopeptide (TPR) repeat protein